MYRIKVPKHELIKYRIVYSVSVDRKTVYLSLLCTNPELRHFNLN